MKREFRALTLSLVIALMAFFAAAQNAAQGKLRVYFVDVRGGQSTLFVTPEGHSLLIDTGWPDHNFRDADRIAAAAKSAGLSRIDEVVITHFHEDHAGGVPQLVQRIPVGAFFEIGTNAFYEDGRSPGRS